MREYLVSDKFRMSEFISFVQGRDKVEIIELAEREAREAYRRSAFTQGAPKARAMGSLEYSQLLKNLIAFLRSEVKPMMIKDWDFGLFKPVAEELVSKGQINPEVLKLFDCPRL